MLLRNGKPIESALHKEAITESELVNAALEKGFSDLGDVGLIVLETNGQMVCLAPQRAKRLRPQMLEQALGLSPRAGSRGSPAARPWDRGRGGRTG